MTELPAQPREPMHRRRLIGAAAALLTLAVIAGVYGIGHLRSNPADAACRQAVETAAQIAPLVRGEVAALALTRTPFSMPNLAFKDSTGHPRTLADWRGHTVLLNLWATWCVPCRREMPSLDKLQAELGGPNFEVVAVNIDTRDPEKPLNFLREVRVTHLAYYSDQSAQVFEDLKTAGKAFGMPTTLVVDRAGCEIGDMAGPAEWASDDGTKLVSAVLSYGH
ncbi:MAG: TlpA disulfide reductase family protein [Xanthobacteraceae bacterium]